jgi:hypothetical protein
MLMLLAIKIVFDKSGLNFELIYFGSTNFSVSSMVSML